MDDRGVFLTEDDNGNSDNNNDEVYEYNNEMIHHDTGKNMKNRSKKEQEIGADTDTNFEKEDDSNEDEVMEIKEILNPRNNVVRCSSTLLLETLKTPKDGDKAAFKAEQLDVAAYWYGKAIQYGSVAYMNNKKRNFSCFDGLLKTLIMSWSNLALVLLSEYFVELKVAEK